MILSHMFRITDNSRSRRAFSDSSLDCTCPADFIASARSASAVPSFFLRVSTSAARARFSTLKVCLSSWLRCPPRDLPFPRRPLPPRCELSRSPLLDSVCLGVSSLLDISFCLGVSSLLGCLWAGWSWWSFLERWDGRSLPCTGVELEVEGVGVHQKGAGSCLLMVDWSPCSLY